jgi:Cd2+/Zn2+-exporting ATPase
VSEAAPALKGAADHDEQEYRAHLHHHHGSLMGQLVMTFVGGIFVLNAWLCDILIFEDRPEIGAYSALIGALILAFPIVISAIKDLVAGRTHMSVLVAVAVVAAISLGDYQTAGIVAFFLLMASLIEQRTAEGARDSIEALIRLTPTTAELIDGRTVGVSELTPGDRIRVRPGDNIPADGRIAKGESSIYEATITGESLPADKGVGAEVFAGTQNMTGALEIEVTRTGEDTTLGRVKELILQAEETKTPFQQTMERYVAWYTPVVLMVAAIIWFFTGEADRAVVALVVTCPCALVLATPTAMVAALSCAARLGILVKNVGDLEAAGNLSAVVFDKTGTLTTGELTVTRLSPVEGVDAARLLQNAASLEANSRHPVARAVVAVARKANVPLLDVEGFEEVAGKGVRARVHGRQVLVGRLQWIQDQGVDTRSVEKLVAAADTEGVSLLFVSDEGEVLGWVGLEDKTRPEAKKANAALTELGVQRLAMLTGDRWTVARKVAAELGCNEVQAECLPETKLRLVEAMREEGYHVGVVGDGVNDAPALAAGDLGIAMGAAGSDIAIHSASIALMSNDLSRLPFLIRLSHKLRAVVYENLVFGIIFVITGLLLSGFGYLHLIAAAILHNVGSFIVIFNSARLVRFGENLMPYAASAVDRGAPSGRWARGSR